MQKVFLTERIHEDAVAYLEENFEVVQGTSAEAEEVYTKSDFVIVHTSLFSSTFHLVGAQRFRLMKPTAFIINAARGPVIDEAAMIEALQKGKIAGAGLDVCEQEPPASGNPLFVMYG